MEEIISFEPPKTLLLKLSGDLTPEQTRQIHDAITQMPAGAGGNHILVDLSELKGIPPETREALGSLPHEVTCEKLAVFGASARLRILGTLLVKLLTHIKKSKFCTTEQEVRSWLKEDAA